MLNITILLLTRILIEIGRTLLDLVFTIVLIILIIYALRYYILSVGALLWKEPKRKFQVNLKPDQYPKFSILIPMHNEEKVVATTLDAILKINYPKDKIEVVCIDDASTDRTGEICEQYRARFPQIFKVVHRPREAVRGKAAALNDGLDHATGDYIVIFDADHKAHPEILNRFLAKFLEADDPRLGAVQGSTRYINEDENLITKIIAKERDPCLLVYLRGEKRLNLLPYTAGSAVCFKREVFEKIGKFNVESVTDDTDFSTRMYLAGYRVEVEPEAYTYEEAINNLRALRRRTYRWARGHTKVMLDYWKQMARNPYLTLKQRIWGLIFLAYYTIPTIILVGMILYGLSFVYPLRAFLINWTLESWLIFTLYYLIFTLSSILTMMAVGMILRRRSLKDLWVYGYMILIAPMNIIICTKALLDLALKRPYVWAKTPRSGVITARIGEGNASTGTQA